MRGIIPSAVVIGTFSLASCTGMNSVEFSVDPATGKTTMLVTPVKPVKESK